MRSQSDMLFRMIDGFLDLSSEMVLMQKIHEGYIITDKTKVNKHGARIQTETSQKEDRKVKEVLVGDYSWELLTPGGLCTSAHGLSIDTVTPTQDELEAQPPRHSVTSRLSSPKEIARNVTSEQGVHPRRALES